MRKQLCCYMHNQGETSHYMYVMLYSSRFSLFIPCSGVKICPRDDCDHTVPVRDKRNCPKHDIVLKKTCNCPVEFVYLYPNNTSDTRRWFREIVRCQKSQSVNLHNHKIHASCKIAQCSYQAKDQHSC